MLAALASLNDYCFKIYLGFYFALRWPTPLIVGGSGYYVCTFLLLYLLFSTLFLLSSLEASWKGGRQTFLGSAITHRL